MAVGERAPRAGRALCWVGVSAEQQQLLSPSNRVQHINYASSKLRPAFNHFYSWFVPILHLCCRESFVLFLEPLHISVSFAFFSLVFSSVDVFHLLFLFLFFFFPPVISFYSPFNSCSSVLLRKRLYLLLGFMYHASLTYCLFNFCIFSLLSHSTLPHPNFCLPSPPEQPLGHAVFLAEFSMQCVQRADLCLPQLPAPRASSFVVLQRTKPSLMYQRGGRKFYASFTHRPPLCLPSRL